MSGLDDLYAKPEDRWSRHVLRWLRTGTALAVAVCLLGLLAGGWYGARRAAYHEATAVVLISPLAGNAFSPDGTGSDLVNLETEAQLVRSNSVADDVLADLGLSLSPAELLETVSVEVPPNTQILRISAEDKDPDRALSAAQAFAESYLDFRRARALAASSSLAEQVAEQVAERQKELNRRSRDLAAQAPDSPGALLLRQQILDINTQLVQLRAQLSALQATRAEPGEVVTPAALPETGLLGERELMAGLGLLVGVGGSLGVAAVRARRDGRVRSVDDLAEVGVPVLGEVSATDDGDDLTTAGLRSGILAALPQRPLVLALVSAGREVHVADGLARSMARARYEAVLVELTSGAGHREGVSDLVLDRASVDDVLVPVTSHLSRVVPGRMPERLPDLLGSPDMGAALTEMGKRADVVVLEAGSAHEPWSQAVVRHSHGVLLEVHADSTTLKDISAARSMIWSSGGQVVGLVLVHQQEGDLGR
ncbi:hypothetical protein [Nocardioides campestrisoli]|uniref:hypothetical protein n=1 Tax=Nocardioides campestrisoli TaxID=2736757 RepID=UPI0015E7185D|nr:hypothetical protein [Nocardioides campestrisoli]